MEKIIKAKNICFLLSLLLTVLGMNELKGQSQYGNFPFQASFLDKKVPPGVKYPGSTNSAKPLDEGMQLTDAAENQFGAIYLNNHTFKSELGIYIEFEYMVYDGTGGDGLCVFFFNANEQNPNIGAPGAGLGYTYNRAPFVNSHYRAVGLKSAYLGIALDSYGNFSGMRWQGESRVQGVPYSRTSSSGTGTGSMQKGNEVTLRGAYRVGGTNIPGMGEGFSGYPVLITQRTNTLSPDSTGFILTADDDDPKYRRYDNIKSKQRYTLRGGYSFDRPGQQGYRKAFIEMFPNGDASNPGFFVSVIIQTEAVRDTVIYDYNYKARFRYYENAYNTSTTGDNDADDNSFNFTAAKAWLDVQLPIELKIGFAAATGMGNDKRTDKHIIKNVGIRLPESAEANDDFLPNQWVGTPVIEFQPLLNDIGYTGTVARHKKGSPEHLDPGTFKFIDANGNIPANQYELVVAGEGTWRYTYTGDYTTAKATFYPLPTFKDEARVRYIIKAKNDAPVGPHGDDAYYSVPATLGVDFVVNPNPGRNIISNKMVTPALR